MLTLEPIGFFQAVEQYPYDVPRQGVLASANQGIIRLLPGQNFEQALEELSGFSHIWVLFWFHLKQGWRPKVRPPRHVARKVGVFASRSPYRPNPLGFSVLTLKNINGLEITIENYDLLDGTPILDLKPYLPYADSFPEATAGWTSESPAEDFEVRFSSLAEQQLQWLSAQGLTCLRAFLQDHLSSEPENPARHRLIYQHCQTALAYRTWRAFFTVSGQTVQVQSIVSGYSWAELLLGNDKYGDKQLHRRFQDSFPAS